MNVGVLEFRCHHIFLYSLVSVAKNSGANVTIFTTRDLYDLIVPLFRDTINEYRWVIRNEHEKLLHFLKKVETIANQEIDLLFVNTLQGSVRPHISYFLFNPTCRKVLGTGRAMEWFDNAYHFRFSSLRDTLSRNISHFIKKKMLSRFDGIVVHTQAVKKYVLAHGYRKDVFVLPFSIYEGNAAARKNIEKIKFIVLGSIAEQRRDYDGLLRAFERLCSSNERDLSLTLLGWPLGKYGNRIITQCEFLKENGFDIRFYNNYIPEEVYKNEVMSADVIINPIRLKNYPYGGFTAGLVEAIRHAKPGIYPARFQILEELTSSSLFYNKIEELPDLIKNLLDNKELLRMLSKNAIINSEKFSLQRVTDYFRDSVMSKFYERI